MVDTDAKKPDDWDDEEDGEWEAPVIPNPEYKGEWQQKMIENPDYKGIWVAPDIPNPAFKSDPTLYHFPDSKYVGFELWQVKSGSIFDNIIVTDSVDEAKKLAEATWAKSKDAEKEMAEKVKAEEEEARKAEMAASAGGDDEYDDFDDYADDEEEMHEEL
mmetsp:Transcript_16713/g.34964  ORF Transcript_16713/g.34964 Transcript_16713/m.34964 type:complete len:160 (+) Transcript_16713:1-480(+)